MRDLLYITFEEHSVEIDCQINDVIDSLKISLGPLATHQPQTIIGSLLVTRTNSKFQVSGNTSVVMEDGSADDLLRCLRFSVLQLLIQARSELLWFHAGAVANHRGALLFPAPRGSGKSTLVTNLINRGWHYLSDDVAPFDMTLNTVIPFPQLPAFREDPGGEMPEHWLREPNKTPVILAGDLFATEPSAVTAIIVPMFDREAVSTLEQWSPATAAAKLLESCWNFADHKERAVKTVCNLVGSVPTFKLQFSDGTHAAEMVSARLGGA